MVDEVSGNCEISEISSSMVKVMAMMVLQNYSVLSNGFVKPNASNSSVKFVGCFWKLHPCYSTLATASNMSMDIGGGLHDHSWTAIASSFSSLGSLLYLNNFLLNTITI